MNAIFAILNPNNTVTINRPLAHAIGLNETIVYGALLAKYQYYAENGSLYEGEWFYSTVSDLGESTTLSEKQQKHCVDMLCFHGLIECRKMGMPAKRYFRIIEDIALLENLIKQGSESIRKVTYIVRSAPSEKATDTLEKKVERLIKKGAEQIMRETTI